MTQIDGLVDLESLIDFDAPVICESQACLLPGETAVAMVNYKYCKCRFPVGVSCVQRMTLYVSRLVETHKYVKGHSRCGNLLSPPRPAAHDQIKFEAL